jgi:hypothetical protein
VKTTEDRSILLKSAQEGKTKACSKRVVFLFTQSTPLLLTCLDFKIHVSYFQIDSS